MYPCWSYLGIPKAFVSVRGTAPWLPRTTGPTVHRSPSEGSVAHWSEIPWEYEGQQPSENHWKIHQQPFRILQVHAPMRYIHREYRILNNLTNLQYPAIISIYKSYTAEQNGATRMDEQLGHPKLEEFWPINRSPWHEGGQRTWVGSSNPRKNHLKTI